MPRHKKDYSYIFELGGHGATEYSMFFAHPIGEHHRSPYYEVCFRSQWEPYYVVHRDAPLYDERFKNQGGDKQQHALHLNALGYPEFELVVSYADEEGGIFHRFRFFVLRDHFIYHLDHEPGMRCPFVM